MDAGALVPDEVVIAIIKERLSQEGLQKRFYPGWLSQNGSAGGGA